ncbi:hypothetical protein E5F71_24450 [Shigella flexneri]|nr:hypothetical protein E5F71_24450 [Shigella flexneri]HAH5381714.1 hypothetical protein [Escherichia coli]HAH5948719.1 hypothetical protein [Escherichia coli]
MPKIIRALSADAHLVVSLLRRETVRSCGGVNGAELPMLCQRSGEKNRDRMCNCNTVTRDAITIAIWSGLRPDTPPTPHGPRKNSASRSPFSDEKVCRFDPFAPSNRRNRPPIVCVNSYSGA